jgi:hypothetical protein
MQVKESIKSIFFDKIKGYLTQMTKLKNINIYLIVLIILFLSFKYKSFLDPILPTNAFFGPKRWWNFEVNLHFVDILQNYKTSLSIKSLFSASLPSGLGDGYNLKLGEFNYDIAAGELRFAPGYFGYISFPPAMFIFSFILGGFVNNPLIWVIPAQSLILIYGTVIYITLALRNILKEKDTSNTILITVFVAGLVFFSPTGLHYNGTVLWNYSLILFLFSLAMWLMSDTITIYKIKALSLIIFILPWVSFTGTISALIFVIFIFMNFKFGTKKYESPASNYSVPRKFQFLPIYSLLFSYTSLIIWVFSAFKNPINVIQALTRRANDRQTWNNDSYGRSTIFQSVLDSFSPWLYLCLIGFVYILILTVLNRITRKTILLLLTTFSISAEIWIFDGHATIYPFAQLIILPFLSILIMYFVELLINLGVYFRLPKNFVRATILVIYVIIVIWAIGNYSLLYDPYSGYYAFDNTPRPFDRELLGNAFPMKSITIR